MPLGPCIKLEPCSCCCPGMSRYDQVQVAITLPNVGWSIGPVTLTQTVLVGGSPTGYRCCHCHCQYCLSLDGISCFAAATPEHPCEEFPTGGDAVLIGADFTCDPSAPEGGCNPPPGGNGIELPFNGSNSARTLCNFTVLLTFTDLTCTSAYQFPNCGIAGTPGPGPIGGVLDCTTATCRCPHGLYLKYGPPLYCIAGVVPPFPVTDPDGFIEISAVQPAGDCPDNFPCPEGIYG